MNTSEIRKENLINLYNDNGQKHGYWERYYYNGQLICKGNYVNGKEHGYWEYYWSNGNLDSKGNYVNGKEHGYWEDYYSNGKLRYKGYYDMGNKVDYNPDEPKVIELTLSDIASKLNIDVNQLRIKE
jgi:antitoxin component YwqK of YwqJK toxin-antitoxin module